MKFVGIQIFVCRYCEAHIDFIVDYFMKHADTWCKGGH